MSLPIFKLTFKAALSRRVLTLSLAAGAVLGLLALMMATISLDQNERIVTDIILAGAPLISIAISVVVSAYLVMVEQEKGILLLMLSKPLSRSHFIMGKALGLITAAMAIMIIISAVSLLIVSLVYPLPILAMMLSLYLGLLELIVLVAVAVLLATVSTPVLSTLLTVGVFIVGHQLNLIYYAAAQGGKITDFLGGILYYLLPNLEKYNLREYFDSALSLPASFYGWTTIYTLVYILLLMILAIVAINKREW